MPSLARRARRAYALAGAALALALAAALSPRPAHAWNRAGHMVSGAMAYRDLVARDPAAAARVVAILRQHPHYENSWLPVIEKSGRPHDEMLFAMAARWPDDIRSDPNFHRGAWHYVNYPLVVPGDTVTPPATPAGEIVTVLPRTIAVLGDSATPDAQKAIALCWLFHLVGDIHQPLHSVTLFGAQWPRGDRGGNLFWVKPGVADRAVNLHAFWDDVVIADDEARGGPMAKAADRLAKAFPRDALATHLAVMDPVVWAREEGVPLARAEAYREFRMPGVADTTMQKVPIVPSGYRKQARAVGERQLALASYRLSAQLAATFGARP